MSLFKLLVAVVISVSAFAQSPRQFHNISNGWTDLNLSGRISGKFS